MPSGRRRRLGDVGARRHQLPVRVLRDVPQRFSGSPDGRTPRAVDSVFAGWTGCDSVSGTTCTVTMAKREVRHGHLHAEALLAGSVTKGGIGKGTVTSSPAGVNCGTACSSDFVINTTVTLTATPALGSVFNGWTGCDAVNGSTCTVLVTSNKSVSASFLGSRFPKQTRRLVSEGQSRILDPQSPIRNPQSGILDPQSGIRDH
jgi:hypothetical protein